MKLLVVCKNQKNVYSGGRYHAWMLSQALAIQGIDVVFWTDNIPAYKEDLDFGSQQDVSFRICLTRYFFPLFRESFDALLVVPDHGRRFGFYYSALFLASSWKAQIVLMNFETPNWFNTLACGYRSPRLWRHCRNTAKFADIILSISSESEIYAKKFFSEVQKQTKFMYHYPPINSLVADSIKNIPKENQIICISRFSKEARHKGGAKMINLITPELSGCTIKFIIGRKGLDRKTISQFYNLGQRNNIKIEFLFNVTDREKFDEISRSKAMVFLSFFEGFGYPPVESLYCNTPCIVFDLPVLREVSGNGLIYVKKHDFQTVVRELKRILGSPARIQTAKKEWVFQKVNFFSNAERARRLFMKNLNKSSPNIANAQFFDRAVWFIWLIAGIFLTFLSRVVTLVTKR